MTTVNRLRRYWRPSGLVLLPQVAIALLTLSITPRMTSAQQSPEQVVDSAFRAIARRDWVVLRDLMDPTTLDLARQENLGMLILVAEQRRAGEDAGGGYNPQDVIIADHIATVGSVRAPRFGNATIAELAALSPAEFYVRWLDAAYTPDRAGMIEDIVDRTRSIVGSVTVGDSAWVLYHKDARWQEDDLAHITTPGTPEILPLRRANGRWRILPNFELAHGPDITGMFEDHPEGDLPAPARREVQHQPIIRAGPPRHADAVPSPIVVVDSAFDALARKDWPRFTTLVDSRRLAAFQLRAIQQLVALLSLQKMRSANDSGPFTSGGVMIGGADLEKAGSERVDIMRGRPTIDELRRLSPAEFFMRWCEVAFSAPSSGDPRVERHYLGTVFEGEDHAHVLYRSSAFVFDLPAQVVRMSLRYADGHWRILLNEETDGESTLAMRFLR
jgi:hypothetical protein